MSICLLSDNFRTEQLRRRRQCSAAQHTAKTLACRKGLRDRRDEACTVCRHGNRDRVRGRNGQTRLEFQGHGNEELWRINGKSYPQTNEPILKTGQRHRLILKNLSADDHPMHLHRHTFEVRQLEGNLEMHGLRKDVVLIRAKSTAEVEFVADNPGKTLFHCHQQDHMDRGFMMVFRYA
jgi:FtsP/CotA-like multicopper oxidase with cupredoxin domain